MTRILKSFFMMVTVCRTVDILIRKYLRKEKEEMKTTEKILALRGLMEKDRCRPGAEL